MKMFIRPSRPEIKIRNPLTGQHVPAEGQTVEASSYWTRRLLDGDLVEGPLPTEAAQLAAPKKQKKDTFD